MPTVLELMGFEPPDGLDGKSLMDLFAPGEPATDFPDRIAFTEACPLRFMSERRRIPPRREMAT